MPNNSHLSQIVLTIALINPPVVAVLGQPTPSQGKPLSVPAIPAMRGRYDFQWEIYTARPALGGKAFHVFAGRQPVGIATLGMDGKPEIFPIVSGAAAKELRASFERFARAKGVGRTSPEAIPWAPHQPTSGGVAPTPVFDIKGIHVSLNDATKVDFLADSIEVAMPEITPRFPGTTLSFNSKVRNGVSETEVTMNGQPMKGKRSGPVWDGIKDLVLTPALYKAAQAAYIASNAPGRPADAPDNVALVAVIETAFGIVPISFFRE